MYARVAKRAVNSALLLSAVFALAIVFWPATPTYAGRNGQQVSVWAEDPSMKLYRVVIEGRNQDNAPATWDSLWATKCHEYSDCAAVHTNNWWWKGNVKITIYQDSDEWPELSCEMFITDHQWFSDWVGITFYNVPARGSGCYYGTPNDNY